ncbi:hypothetical protein O6H91_18G045300 [Diphasiastrum complanatum]|uniref:Uncharacterized protein n=1 Tax=Diphasiastrum complanatum TaxID=34168 RepID=A0ACC2B0I2_DIPCM|nr:hypothetical protein O6H91_18G045300 [Diphasiastrum complanatum]
MVRARRWRHTRSPERKGRRRERGEQDGTARLLQDHAVGAVQQQVVVIVGTKQHINFGKAANHQKVKATTTLNEKCVGVSRVNGNWVLIFVVFIKVQILCACIL